MALTLVYGTIVGEDGTGVGNVTVKATINAVDPVIATPDGGTTLQTLFNKTSTTTTNASGYWAITLFPNSAVLEPKNSTYTFEFDMPATAPSIQPYYAYANTIQAHGASFTHSVVVPSASGVDFATLV